ncbi:MAG: PilZ domain-containing protein [Candidatus Brocadiales bacterium]|nr:PilZ domain-containing protein [Candidatus Brocadiales bacterium]
MNRILESRKYVRIEKPYITRFQVQSNEEMICSDWDMIAVINLSAGGIFFYARKNLEVGTILDLRVGFSFSHPSIKCVGRVIRAKRHLDTSIIGFAIEFTEINEQIKKEICKTVSETETHNSNPTTDSPQQNPDQT